MGEDNLGMEEEHLLPLSFGLEGMDFGLEGTGENYFVAAGEFAYKWSEHPLLSFSQNW